MSVDPTAIKIDWDPRQQRMRGIAVHGETPFDVPYVSEIADNLWTGGCTNGLVLPAEVKHLVSLYPWESYTLRHDLDSALVVRQYDALAVDEELVRGVAEWVNVCRKTGVTLVHCQAGLNRSGLVAGLALVLSGMTPADAVALMREKRSPAVLCNPTFAAWLHSQDAA